MRNRRLSRTIRTAVPLAVTVALFAWLLTRVHLASFARTLRSADVTWLALAILACVASIGLGVEKWRTILARMGSPVPFRDALVACLGCFPVRFATPLKVGEILKAVYLNRRLGLRLEVALSSVAFDKATNIAAISGFATIGALVFDLHLNRPIAVAALLLLFLAATWSQFQRAILPLARRLPGKAGDFVERLLAAFHEIPPARRTGIWGLTLLVFAMEAVIYVLCARTMGLAVPFGRIVLLMPLVILFSNIPVSASGIGIREAAIVFFFAPAGPPERLLAWGVCVSFVDQIFIVLLGLPFMRSFLRGALGAARGRTGETADAKT